MRNLIKKILKESADDFGWTQDLANELKWHQDEWGKGYLNADGERMGSWKHYWWNGNLGSKGEFLNGQRTGAWEYYYENGNLASKGEYLNGEANGPWEYYWENGNLSSKGEFLNGEVNGPWEYYYQNGELDKIINY